MDFVEVTLAIEEEFEVEVPWDRWDAALQNHPPPTWWIFRSAVSGDMTVAELTKLVNKTLADQDLPVPHDTLDRLQLILAEVLGVKASNVQPGTFLVKDLGMD